MKIPVDVFVDKLDKFILSDVTNAASLPSTKFAVGFFRPIALQMVKDKLAMMCNLGVFGTGHDVVDTEILKTCMNSAFDAGGADGAPKFFGLRLERTDVEKFFSEIEG